MKMFANFLTIRRLMICILALAVLLAGGRHVVGKWGPGEVVSCCVVILVGTNIVAWFQSARWQVFWVGLGLAGWAYCFLSFESTLAEYLPTTRWLDGIHERLYPTHFTWIDAPLDFNPGHERWSRIDLFRRAGHAIFSLVFGLLGGTLGLLLFRPKLEAEKVDEPPDGSLLERDWRDSTSA